MQSKASSPSAWSRSRWDSAPTPITSSRPPSKAPKPPFNRPWPTQALRRRTSEHWDLHATATHTGDYSGSGYYAFRSPELGAGHGQKRNLRSRYERRQRLGADRAVHGLRAGPTIPDTPGSFRRPESRHRGSARLFCVRPVLATFPPASRAASSPWASAASTPAHHFEAVVNLKLPVSTLPARFIWTKIRYVPGVGTP